MSCDVIKDNDTVIIRMHDESGCMLQVSSTKDQKIGKSTLNVKALIGAPFGSVFEIDGRKIIRVKDEQINDINLDEQESRTGDNRSFIDSNTAQKLTDEDINKLRKSGASGTTIIQSLIANSETWNNKTEFAQEKWLKRKQKKYFRRFRVIKCTPSTLCEAYHWKNNNKICNMRWDTLAQVMSRGGVGAGSHVLVFESLMGLITGSLAYRMRGHGRILSVFPGQQPHLDLVDRLNLSDSDLSIIHTIPSNELHSVSTAVLQDGFRSFLALSPPPPPPPPSSSSSLSAGEEIRENGVVMEAAEMVIEAETQRETETETETEIPPVCEAEREDREARHRGGRRSRKEPVPRPHQSSCKQPGELERARQVLLQGATSLVIASRFHPLSVLIESLPLLTPSSSLVVYCEFMEPLVECYLHLQKRNLAIGMQLTDTWVRDYQNLPGRFHPKMFIPASGGYLLSGIYVGMPTLLLLSHRTPIIEMIENKSKDTTMNLIAENMPESKISEGVKINRKRPRYK